MNTIWNPDLQRFVTDCQSQAKYQALAAQIETAIASGELVHGQKMPAQRWLADVLNVTHGTVTRGYALAETRALVVAKRGAGTYVNAPLECVVKGEIIDFAASMQPMLGQQNILAQAMHELADDSRALQQVMTYAIDGVARHKVTFAQWLSAKGIVLEAEELIFTQGAQQGIYSCLQVLTNAGDTVVHESLTYPGFTKAAQASGLNCRTVTLTSAGIDLDELAEICQQQAVKVVYITPNMQNPTNIQYSDQQRQKLVELSHIHQFYIIEDDVNYTLSQQWRCPLQQLDSSRVIYLSSLSKYFAGGLRIGYLLAPKTLQQGLKNQIHSQCWMVSPINFELISRVINTEHYQRNQQLLEQELCYRQQVFKQLFSDLQLPARLGGLNIWLELPNTINMHQLSGLLLARNVKVRTADVFCTASNPLRYNALRISLGGPATRVLFEQGVAVFAEVLQQLQQQGDVVI